MKIIDFNHSHIQEAAALALTVYDEERRHVPSLPMVEGVPDLTSFADNGLGVTAFEDNKMIGFLCCVPPFNNAFGSTNVRGIFSPMGANAARKENRTKIYGAMYQSAGEKWVRTGAVSHALCLYAHDEELQRLFYRYGFGLRCMDAIRLIEPICALDPFHSTKQMDSTTHNDYQYTELNAQQFSAVYPLELALNRHFHHSPFFMNRNPETREEFAASCKADGARIFAANDQDELCAYLQIADSGETFAAGGLDYCHINGAYCLPKHRGKGIYQNLMKAAAATLKAEGYERLGVDFESFNPTAYGFWTKYFTPYTHGVVRRIDERILELDN